VEGSRGKCKKRQAMKPSLITKYFDGKGLEKKNPHYNFDLSKIWSSS
jgi:hypothetical protein